MRFPHYRIGRTKNALSGHAVFLCLESRRQQKLVPVGNCWKWKCSELEVGKPKVYVQINGVVTVMIPAKPTVLANAPKTRLVVI